MISLKYSHASIDTLKATMLLSHDLFIRVRLLDLNHNYLDNLSQEFVDGQVNFDATSTITRSLDLTLFDPFKSIHLDPDSPSPTGVFISNMISITYVVRQAGRAQVWEIPVFTGPIDAVDRDGLYLNIKCLGKEALSIGNLYRGRTFRKGQKKTTVIRQILTQLCGETKLTIPDLNAKMPNDLSLNRSHSPLLVAKRLASSMGYMLFYDGRGVAVLRRIPTHVTHTFRMEALVNIPRMSYDLTQTINAVDVIGKKPKKAKHRIQYHAVAPRAHALSPTNLGRGGVPRYLWKEIKDDNINSNKEAKDTAERHLRQGLLAGVDTTFDGIPYPLAEELDVARLSTPYTSAEFHLRQWTLPLVAGEDAAFGYLRRAKVRGRSVKRGGKKK